MESLETNVALVGFLVGVRLAMGDEGGHTVKSFAAHLNKTRDLNGKNFFNAQ